MLLLVADSPPQALLEAHSFICKLITQSYSPETLYALDNFEVSTVELICPTTTLQYELIQVAHQPRTHSILDHAWPAMHAWVAWGHVFLYTLVIIPLFVKTTWWDVCTSSCIIHEIS